jgi:hypothetical protein
MSNQLKTYLDELCRRQGLVKTALQPALYTEEGPARLVDADRGLRGVPHKGSPEAQKLHAQVAKPFEGSLASGYLESPQGNPTTHYDNLQQMQSDLDKTASEVARALGVTRHGFGPYGTKVDDFWLDGFASTLNKLAKGDVIDTITAPVEAALALVDKGSEVGKSLAQLIHKPTSQGKARRIREEEV